MDDKVKEFGQRILEALEVRNMKATDLASSTGLSRGAISSYISGRWIAKQNNVYLIAKALNVNEAWLMGFAVPMNRVDLDISELNNIEVNNTKNNFDMTEKNNQSQSEILDLYSQLDLEDKAEIRGTIKQMLKHEKYKKADAGSSTSAC